MPQAVNDNITDPETISELLGVLTTEPQSVSDLIKLHARLTGMVDRGSFSESAEQCLCLASGDLRFDIAKTPAKNAQDVAAKALFFIDDYCDVGPCDEFAAAMRASLQEDFLRLGGVNV
jgi:hypothetical protein